MSLAELKQQLSEDVNGNNLYSHLVEVLIKLADNPKKAYENFELISAEVKNSKINGAPAPLLPSAEEVEKQTQWTKKCAALLKAPEEGAEDPAVQVPDLMELATLFKWGGVNFGDEATYRLYLSIKAFAKTVSEDAVRLRFFGRINTRSLPYYIIEGMTGDMDEVDPKLVEGKEGANKYTYWVTQDVESCVWTKLPHVTMAQIVSFRLSKRFLTGYLGAEVAAYPPFPGDESSLLRTMIACIAGATTVSPDGFYEMDEESDPPVEKMAEAEAIAERFPKPANELKEADAWKHHERDLNALGRITAMPEELDDAGEPIEQEAVELTEPLAALKPEAWSFRVCPGGAGASSTSVVVARNLQWPGAIAVASGRRFTNVYVGNGVAFNAKAYTPPLPGAIQKEWAASEEELAATNGIGLLEEKDQTVDPTPPAEEGEED